MIKDGEVRPEGCICEPCSDIPPNWKDIRTKFRYTEVKQNFSSPWTTSQVSENHLILPPSFNQHKKENKDMCQIALQHCITTVKRLTTVRPKFFLMWWGVHE